LGSKTFERGRRYIVALRPLTSDEHPIVGSDLPLTHWPGVIAGMARSHLKWRNSTTWSANSV